MEREGVDAVVYNYGRAEVSAEGTQVFEVNVFELSALLAIESVGEVLVMRVKYLDNLVSVIFLKCSVSNKKGVLLLRR